MAETEQEIRLGIENRILREMLLEREREKMHAQPQIKSKPARERKPARKEKRVAAAAAESEPDWTKVRKFCIHCGKTKLVMPDFGLRNSRGVRSPQPWCKECRSTTSKEYYRATRKYKTKHNP